MSRSIISMRPSVGSRPAAASISWARSRCRAAAGSSRRPIRRVSRSRWSGLVRNGGLMTELFIFARFQAREGQAEAVLAALHEVAGPTRQEPGCLAMNYFRATRDPNAIFLHSRWTDEAAFELHA